MKRVSAISLMIVVLTIAFDINAYAIDNTTVKFTEYFGTSAIAQARSPFRALNGADQFNLVTGPNNQPRFLSSVSDLHDGTDFHADARSVICSFHRTSLNNPIKSTFPMTLLDCFIFWVQIFLTPALFNYLLPWYTFLC